MRTRSEYWAGPGPGYPPNVTRFLFRQEAGRQRARETSASCFPLGPAAGSAGMETLVLRPWIRELILRSEALSSPQAGQLLKVLQDVVTPGPSHAPDILDGGAMLLVSDGTHSVRCLVTQEALSTSEWEEKEFGFTGAEGRLLLLQVCEVRIQIADRGSPAEFYLQVDRFNLLPTEQPRVPVTGCNQDFDVQRKLYDCLQDHLSESNSSNAGLTLSQLLDEVQEDQEHRGALVRLAGSCLTLAGPCPDPPLTRWAAARCRATEEALYTVPSLLLHISETDQQILNSLGLSQRAQGAPALPGHEPLEDSSASISLLPAVPLAAPDPVQRDRSQLSPIICLAPGPLLPNSPHRSQTPNSPHLSCTPSLQSLGPALSPHQAHNTRPRKLALEFKEQGSTPNNQQPSPRTRTKRAQESCAVWDPPKTHCDGSAFQYEYEPPCASLCAQVQAARLPPQLVAWALHLLMEPESRSELTQV
ncbi:PREDICTED: adrenocortical dysplasia protein homolog [Chinchilla lanigera]|uniref:ACD shelterin complex subunit and telomerase recruitment factor n=1 Tax=Chinchilla lanigera TaxID=34839 RepID=A0A8C2V0P8_CHILA|nr:PREDICTED: adrenocortical dysplasia protein homolog [Chinchilla lanigera]